MEVLQQIGSGHYGTVHKGLYESHTGPPLEVAIKSFDKHKLDNNSKKDIKQEIDIMNVCSMWFYVLCTL